MLSVEPVGARKPPLQPGQQRSSMFTASRASEGGDDFAISTDRKPLSRDVPEIKGRDDPANILGHVNIKAGRPSKAAAASSAKPGGYHSVV